MSFYYGMNLVARPGSRTIRIRDAWVTVMMLESRSQYSGCVFLIIYHIVDDVMEESIKLNYISSRDGAVFGSEVDVLSRRFSFPVFFFFLGEPPD